ncbi:MAG: HDOD domain-containing protein [Desulfofustis sp.]|nr:HDOD domain-containing protein [Desulfofustis sp.]
MSYQETIYARIKDSGHVPILPEILLKLLEACDSETTSLTTVASLIDKDPSLSYKVLQLVNSAYFGLRTTYSGVDQAVVYLGANSIKNMAVTAAVHQVFGSEQFSNLEYFNIHLFWYHSLKCATLARRFAEKTRLASPEDSYLGGLLHDLGKLVLVSAYPKQYETVLAEMTDTDDLIDMERDQVGVSHCDIGAWLIRDWKLSSMIADTIGYHHEAYERVEQALPLVKIVYAANQMSRTEPEQPQHGAAASLLGLSRDEIDRIVVGVDDEILQIASELGIVVEVPVLEDGRDGRIVVKGADESAINRNLASRIKGISLLSGFLENVAQAGDSEEMLKAFEQSLNVLFGFDRVLLLLPDRDGVLLCGRTSQANRFQSLSRELILPVQKNTSLVVNAYRNRSLGYLSVDDELENLADRQMLSAFECRVIALVPLIAEQKELGVVLIGLPAALSELPANDCRLIRTITQQVALSLYLEDIKRRKAEEVEAERKAAITMTARKFAHEVNNPLGIINNYLAALKLKVGSGNGIDKELGIITDEINRISSMVNQLDVFAQATFTTADPTNLNKVIGDVVQLVKSSFLSESAIRIEFVADHRLPLVETSTDGIKQIILNLMKNSSEAMDGVGTITVTTKLTGSDGTDGTVMIRVADDGPGLPAAVREHLFSPFITTKGIGHSGLGLSIVKKAVGDLGGSISCTSDPGQGTVFQILLPLKKKA